MSVGRITTSQLWTSSMTSIQSSKARLSELTAQASSGLRVTKPSDDPGATASIMGVLSQQQANTQYGTNISDGLGWLSTADSALTSAQSLVQQASDLVVQAANSGTSSPAGRSAIATQLASIRDQLLSTANTSYLGRPVFAGTSDTGTAFSTTTDASGATTYAYDGTAGAAVTRRTGTGATGTVTVSADGAAAFGTGDASVFAKIQKVIDALGSSDYDTDTSSTGPQATITNGLDDLKSALSGMTTVHSTVGVNYSRLETAKTQNASAATGLETQRSGLQDADYASTILDLKTQELTYQTALQVTAQVIQPTLMSFLQ